MQQCERVDATGANARRCWLVYIHSTLHMALRVMCLGIANLGQLRHSFGGVSLPVVICDFAETAATVMGRGSKSRLCGIIGCEEDGGYEHLQHMLLSRVRKSDMQIDARYRTTARAPARLDLVVNSLLFSERHAPP
jgi:hypothetical protein